MIAGLFFYQKRDPVSEGQLLPEQFEIKTGQESTPDLPKDLTVPEDHGKIQETMESGELNENDKRKWTAFTEVLRLKNDNDPRIDRDLKSLSPELHQKLTEAYHRLQKEDRNGRGLVAFLIARDLKTIKDAEFLKSIYLESPCLGFQSCELAAQDDPHLSGINQTSLNYPQIAGLYQLEKRLQNFPDLLEDPEMRRQISEILREARQFPADAVQNKAKQIQNQWGL